jgi:glucokinase
VLAVVARLAQEVAAGTPIAIVGVGAAGVIDRRRGAVVSATDAIAGWAGTEVAAQLEEALACPVVVDNDVKAFAYAELRSGAAAGCRDALAVMVGTGVGAALIHDGALVHGARDTAGAIGHVPSLGADGLRCPCGATGHLEAISSGPAMERRYAAETHAPQAPLRDIAAAARAGDTVASRIVRDGARALGATLGGMVNMLDPEVVVLGGGVMGIGPRYLNAVRAAYAEHLLPSVSTVPIVPGRLGARAVVVGAAAIARQAALERD